MSLFVNAGTTKKSDFVIAEVVVWPRGLTNEEMYRVSNHLTSVYRVLIISAGGLG